jgi:replicative DNA helicase
LQSTEAVDSCIQAGMTVEWFYESRHKEIFGSILSLHSDGKPYDLIVLGNFLKELGRLSDIGGLPYISEILDATPSAANLAYYAEILKEHLIKRRVIAATVDARHAIFHTSEGGDAILGRLEAVIESCRVSGAGSDSESSKVVAGKMIDELQERYEKSKTNNGITGFSTGWKRFDYKTCGLQEGELTLIGARPGVGKSVFLANIALEAGVRNKVPCLFLTAEMRPTKLNERLACAMGSVDGRLVRSAELMSPQHGSQRAAFMQATAATSRASIQWQWVRGANIEELRAIVRSHVRRFGTKMVFVDYLQMIDSARRHDSKTYEVQAVAEGLKTIADESRVAVVAAAQVSRDAEKANRRPRMSDLSDSKGIEQAAEMIVMLHREPDSDEDRLSTEVSIVKQRNGSTGVIAMTFQEEYLRFVEQSPVARE